MKPPNSVTSNELSEDEVDEDVVQTKARDTALLVNQLRQRLVRTSRRLYEQLNMHQQREETLVGALRDTVSALEESISLHNINGITELPGNIAIVSAKFKTINTSVTSAVVPQLELYNANNTQRVVIPTHQNADTVPATTSSSSNPQSYNPSFPVGTSDDSSNNAANSLLQAAYMLQPP